ncbi:MAG: SRPBCC domain-containing protein [Mobilitalea sp.]
MDRIIHCKVRLNCSRQQSFEMFTKNSNIQLWLADSADIEPYVGGKYELFWDIDNKKINSTIGCKITALESNKLLCFEWKGPEQFSHFMNIAEPLTHVTVLFIPDYENDNLTEIHLIHTGWKSDENWEKARIWFEYVWINALENLKNKVAE